MAKTAAERQRDKRKRDTGNVTCHARDITPTEGIEHYRSNPDKYIPRLEPDKLNWGPHLNIAELNAAGLKANRVPIPGDWDYEGVGHGQTTIS
ncbi:hypothetical protein LCGC14_1750340 [marine sediment metagenome]|uniref:Uncharacterized protein n=1 Tax=marine sediment metagenome TaxID=412755 RepID=A0A0F9H463_9ZZZZ